MHTGMMHRKTKFHRFVYLQLNGASNFELQIKLYQKLLYSSALLFTYGWRTIFELSKKFIMSRICNAKWVEYTHSLKLWCILKRVISVFFFDIVCIDVCVWLTHSYSRMLDLVLIIHVVDYCYPTRCITSLKIWISFFFCGKSEPFMVRWNGMCLRECFAYIFRVCYIRKIV